MPVLRINDKEVPYKLVKSSRARCIRITVDYIIVHELCHLIEMKHNERFWKLVKNEMPDYEERRRWLQKNGLMLTL
jgi:hypothetical protein